MIDNPHITENPVSVLQQGSTWLTVSGMACDNFTEEDARNAQALLTKHAVASLFVEYDHDDGMCDLVNTETNELVMTLNMDDETMGIFDDNLVPGLFLYELCRLLADVSIRGFAFHTVEYMYEVIRKGHWISFETDAQWSDFKQLLTM